MQAFGILKWSGVAIHSEMGTYNYTDHKEPSEAVLTFPKPMQLLHKLYWCIRGCSAEALEKNALRSEQF